MHGLERAVDEAGDVYIGLGLSLLLVYAITAFHFVLCLRFGFRVVSDSCRFSLLLFRSRTLS